MIVLNCPQRLGRLGKTTVSVRLFLLIAVAVTLTLQLQSFDVTVYDKNIAQTVTDDGTTLDKEKEESSSQSSPIPINSIIINNKNSKNDKRNEEEITEIAKHVDTVSDNHTFSRGRYHSSSSNSSAINEFSSSVRSKPIVFVCVTGQLSRLELANKVVTLFQPLQRGGCDLEIRFVLSQTNYTKHPNEFASVFDSLSSAYQYLEQHGIRSISSTQHTIPPPTNIPINDHYSITVGENRTLNHARMYVGHDQCWNQWNHATNYSFAIRIREDMGFSTPQDIPSVLKSSVKSPTTARAIMASNCRHHLGVNDRFAIITTLAARDYFTAPYRQYLNLTTTLVGGSERFLKTVYTKYGIKIKATSKLRHIIKLVQNPQTGKSELTSHQELTLRCGGGYKANSNLANSLLEELNATNSLISIQ